MPIRIFIGYFLACGLIGSACVIGAPVGVFVDLPTAVLCFGGTGILLLPLLAGTSIKNLTWLGMPATVFSALTGITVVMIGLIMILTQLKDISAYGPSMAICILGILYTLVFMIFISIPLEDWHNVKYKKYEEITISRMIWLAFPISSIFFALIAISVFFHEINNTPKQPF